MSYFLKKSKNAKFAVPYFDQKLKFPKKRLLRYFLTQDDIIPELDTFECAPTMHFFHLKISKSAKSLIFSVISSLCEGETVGL